MLIRRWNALVRALRVALQYSAATSRGSRSAMIGTDRPKDRKAMIVAALRIEDGRTQSALLRPATIRLPLTSEEKLRRRRRTAFRRRTTEMTIEIMFPIEIGRQTSRTILPQPGRTRLRLKTGATSRDAETKMAMEITEM